MHACHDDPFSGGEPSVTRTLPPSSTSPSIFTRRSDTFLAGASTIQTLGPSLPTRIAEEGRTICGSAAMVAEADMTEPSRKVAGGSLSAILVLLVRVEVSASGAISRTIPDVRMVGSSCSITSKGAPIFSFWAAAWGTSTTASRLSGRAMVTTVWPADTTCPTSAEVAVTTPSNSARSCA